MQETLRLDPSLIMVTGGNGWLGRRVVDALTGGLSNLPVTASGGCRVRCLVPAGDDVRALLERGVEIVSGDIRDERAVTDLVGGGRGGLLIHLAGIIHPRKVTEFQEINTAGTANLLAAARREGVSRMVVMSSNSPMGCNPYPDHRFTEDSPYNPYMGYGRSKWLMELALGAAIVAGIGPEIVILRAPWFYGPGQPVRQTQFFTMIKNGRFPIVGTGSNRRSMGYVDNLTQGVLLASAHPTAAGRTYWIADEIPYSMREIIDTVRGVLRDDFAMKVVDKTIHLPDAVGNIATLADSMLQAIGIYQQKIHVLSEMNKTIACDIARAKTELGYRPAVGLREGMRRSVEWCLANGQTI